MGTVREVLARQSQERLREVLSASPRKFREELFKRLGIKAKAGAAAGFRLSAKSDARAKRFGDMLQGEGSMPEELLSEVVRNYLYTRRSLLADALTFLEVPHKEGLTDRDLDFLSELEEEKREELQAHLAERGHDEEDIQLYLRFMNIRP